MAGDGPHAPRPGNNSNRGNRLLAMLPRDVAAAMRLRMVPINLKSHDVILGADQKIGAVYFPEGGCVSMVAQLANGRLAEVGLVGSEGMVGLPVLLGHDTTSVEWMMQASGVVLKLDVGVFRQMLDDMPALRMLLLRYALTFFDQVSQTAACNVSHTIDQRLARWLLMASDRIGGDTVAMTQDLLGMMLGVRRAGVTVAAGALQKRGLVRCGHGATHITSREGLEAYACECYGSIQRRFKTIIES